MVGFIQSDFAFILEFLKLVRLYLANDTDTHLKAYFEIKNCNRALKKNKYYNKSELI